MSTDGRFLVKVTIEPMPGFEMTRTGGDEHLILAEGDTTRNVLLDTGIVASILDDFARSSVLDGYDAFRHQCGTMWRFKSIEPPPGGREE